MGTQVQEQAPVPGYLPDKVTTTRTRNILQNYL
jgi:hypothetical protein